MSYEYLEIVGAAFSHSAELASKNDQQRNQAAMEHIIKGCLSITFAMLLSACASSGTPIEQSSVDTIVIGTTTKNQLLETFGSPMSQTFNSDGKLLMSWFYVYVGPFGTDMQQQNLTVLFDQKETVEKFSLTDSANNGTRLGN